LFNWDHFAAPYSLYVKRDTIRPLLDVIGKMGSSDEYGYEGGISTGSVERPLSAEEVLDFVNEKGEFIYPTIMFKPGMVTLGGNEFVYYMNTMGPEEINHQTLEGGYMIGLVTPYIPYDDEFWNDYSHQ